jgi:hypothetical protein
MVACSYHHSGVYSKKNSSIKIRRIEREGNFEIKINNSGDKMPICDQCRCETSPLCVRFCVPNALQLEEEVND